MQLCELFYVKCNDMARSIGGGKHWTEPSIFLDVIDTTYSFPYCSSKFCDAIEN